MNTAYIARRNGTFRQHLASLRRRTRTLARRHGTGQRGKFLVGPIDNCCTDPQSRTLRAAGRRRTPAMAAGLTDQRWSIAELLEDHAPLPRWQPLKQRGRRSKERQALIDRWATGSRLSAELPYKDVVTTAGADVFGGQSHLGEDLRSMMVRAFPAIGEGFPDLLSGAPQYREASGHCKVRV